MSLVSMPTLKRKASLFFSTDGVGEQGLIQSGHVGARHRPAVAAGQKAECQH